MQLILASGSPRRYEILTEFGYKFKVLVPNVDEKMDENKTPYENVKEVSYKKASAVFNNVKDALVIACDTVVSLDGVIYGKPKDKNDAYRMIETFSGKTHEVISGVTIMSKNKTYNFYTVSKVTFKTLSNEEILAYVSTEEPYDKAGAYAIQGAGRALISHYEGSLYNIIGLPIEDIKPKLVELLGE